MDSFKLTCIFLLKRNEDAVSCTYLSSWLGNKLQRQMSHAFCEKKPCYSHLTLVIIIMPVNSYGKINLS